MRGIKDFWGDLKMDIAVALSEKPFKTIIKMLLLVGFILIGMWAKAKELL